MLNSSMNTNILVFVFFIHAYCVSASEDVVLKKSIYEFRRYSKVQGEKYLPPVIERLPYTDLKENGGEIKIYPYYDIGEYESKMEQKNIKLIST